MEAVCAQAVLLGDSWVLVLGCLHDAYHEIVEEHKVSILLVSLPEVWVLAGSLLFAQLLRWLKVSQRASVIGLES